MERRLLLVFALTFLVILVFQPLLKKYLPQPPLPEKQTEAQAQPVQPSNPPPTVQAQVPTPPVGAIKQASSEAETVIENDLYRITLTNRGGQVKSWVLKKFDDDDGKPLELVNKTAAPKYGYPLSLWAYDETLRNKLNSVLYIASGEGTQKAPAEITFEYVDQDVAVRKTLRFDHTYVVHVEVSVVSKGSQVTALPMWPAGFGDETSLASYAATKIEYQNGRDVERVSVKKVSGGATVQGPLNWAGVSDQYFSAVFLPEDAQTAAIVTLHNQIDIPKDPAKPQETTKVDVLGAAVGNLHGPTVGRLFVGPKILNVLESVPVAGMPPNVEPDLRQLVDFGWLGVISRPLFVWLRWTYEKMVGNWGWAIAIQTLIINLALMPLRISSMKSALKMQKIQPQMNSIKEKYKKYSLRDPRRQEMNTEIGALMKQEGVSPVGGCLPLLIQMPFLFAYYRMLGVAIDLRHAHWLWIRDLSSADPWHILPIAIIITMLFTQRMTPQAGMDPAQQKMMNLMMPLFLGVISWNLAAGLCLYWSEGNLIAIAQQAIMNKTKLGREMREMMLKRAKKKDK
jgi:YidC/Oxa1 family membrane protein insertase